MKYFSLVTSSLLVALGSPTAAAQTVGSYVGTVLVHGKGDDATLWTTPHGGSSTMSKYNSVIDLKLITLPNLPTSTVDGGATSLRSHLNANPGARVLVGHSMGGIIARRTHQASNTGIAGIVTIASPHHGTWAANNRAFYDAYINNLVYRLRQVAGPATYSVPVVGSYFALNVHLLADYFLTKYGTMLTTGLASAGGTTEQLAVGSVALSGLLSYQGDVGLPRAQLAGSVPVLYHTLRLLASYEAPSGAGFSSWKARRNWVVSVLSICRAARYGTIIHYLNGRKCKYAKNMITRIDRKFFAATTGQSYSSAGPRVFDGVVEETRAQYPHLTDVTRKLLVPGENHLSIVFNQSGVNTATLAMQRIGMVTR